ncbi:hypothetical protein ACWCQW_54745 [Streptomyces mirabilis]
MPERTQTAFPANGLLSNCLDRSEEPDSASPDGSADVTPAAPTTHQAPSLTDHFRMKCVVGLGSWVLCRQDLLDAC